MTKPTDIEALIGELEVEANRRQEFVYIQVKGDDVLHLIAALREAQEKMLGLKIALDTREDAIKGLNAELARLREALEWIARTDLGMPHHVYRNEAQLRAHTALIAARKVGG